MAWQQNKLYTVSAHEVRVASLPLTFAEQPTEIEVKKEQIRIVKPGCVMHGVVVNDFTFTGDDCCIIAFETPDN